MWKYICSWSGRVVEGSSPEIFYTITAFIRRDREGRDSSWDSQYVAKIHTRHASHMNNKCKNPIAIGHSETSWRVSMESGENGKYEKMTGWYTSQGRTINQFLNKVTTLFAESDLSLNPGCHRWQKVGTKQLTICVPLGKYGLSTSGTLMPVSVWYTSNKAQITRVVAHIVAFNMWTYSVWKSKIWCQF